jgi:hypothetical protein
MVQASKWLRHFNLRIRVSINKILLHFGEEGGDEGFLEAVGGQVTATAELLLSMGGVTRMIPRHMQSFLEEGRMQPTMTGMQAVTTGHLNHLHNKTRVQ